MDNIPAAAQTERERETAPVPPETSGPAKPKARYYAVDELRGVAMIFVVIFHFMWTLNAFGFNINPELMPQRLIGYVGAFMFIIISGCSCNFTRRPYLRAAKILGCAIIVWAALEITQLSAPITFGVLHFLGISGLIYALLRKPLEKINPVAGAAVCLPLFALTFNIPTGTIFSLRLPEILYSTKWLFWLGFPHISYTASDYYPLLPWIFLFFFGYFAWRIPSTMPSLKISRCRPLAFIGRHTLLIYLVHQPIFYGILWLVTTLAK